MMKDELAIGGAESAAERERAREREDPPPAEIAITITKVLGFIFSSPIATERPRTATWRG
jgi:hypothetical protein